MHSPFIGMEAELTKINSTRQVHILPIEHSNSSFLPNTLKNFNQSTIPTLAQVYCDVFFKWIDGIDAVNIQIYYWGSKFPALCLESGTQWREASVELGLRGENFPWSLLAPEILMIRTSCGGEIFHGV